MGWTPRWKDLEPETQEAIEDQDIRPESPDQRRCGCLIRRDGRLNLCSYHCGWDDALSNFRDHS